MSRRLRAQWHRADHGAWWLFVGEQKAAFVSGPYARESARTWWLADEGGVLSFSPSLKAAKFDAEQAAYQRACDVRDALGRRLRGAR